MIFQLRRDGQNILRNIRDTRTVLTVIIEAWSGNHESFLGVLDLLDHKLELIESGTKSLLDRASFP